MSRTYSRRDSQYSGAAISPGDILYVCGQGRLMQIGAAGGFMGHVMLVTDVPRKLHPDETAARTLRAFDHFDFEEEPEIWCVCTMESTSSKAGLYETTLLMTRERRSGRLIIVGELSEEELGVMDEVESVEIWQPPSDLRAQMRPGLMEEVIYEMRMHDWASWSLATALRALMTANAFQNTVANRSKLLREIQDCWQSDPICTSVVIIFWQKYLCRLAEIDSLHATDYVMCWMPTKADRALPGELLGNMRETGWTIMHEMPPMEKSARPTRIAAAMLGA